MNGVRRFLGGAIAQPPPPPDINPDTSQTPTTPVKTPLVIPLKGPTGPSWPPQSPGTTGQAASPPASTGSPNLFQRKHKQQPSIPGDEPFPSPSPYGSSAMSPARSQSQSSTRNQLAGPSSPSPTLPSHRIPPPNGGSRQSAHSELDWKRASTAMNTRDELLISLLASEAVVDSRSFEILGSDEVEDLKKEQQVLSSRLVAMTKKVSLETKIRDAAVSLSKVNATHKKLSKQTDDQLEAANRRVEAAQKELWRVSERANEVHKRLMEHRAAVLSISVRSMEKKMAPVPLVNGSSATSDSGYATPGRQSPLSPTTSSMTGMSSSTKAKFDGAHLFAGHIDAIVPRRRQSVSAAANEISTLEQKLKAATSSLNAASKKQAEMARELSLLQLEKQEVETRLGIELQSAEDTIGALEKELPRLEGLDSQLNELLEEKESWGRERTNLQQRVKEADELRVRVTQLEAQGGKVDASDKQLAELKEENRRISEQKDAELKEMKRQWEEERQGWERERAAMEDEKMEDFARLQEEMDRVREEDSRDFQKVNSELDAGLAALRTLMQKHTVALFASDLSLKGLINSVGLHMDGMQARMSQNDSSRSEWDALRKKLEDDVRLGLDKREELSRELEDARREREDARREARSLEVQLKDQPSAPSAVPPLLRRDSSASTSRGDPQGEAARIISVIQPLWNILPSPEARAARFTQQRQFRTGSPTPGSPSGGPASSLSDLDVRTLKTLYDPKASDPNTNRSIGAGGVFSIDAFASRVQALIADDRALIERLVRFAQAHDLLKKNAERAQKLAQESGAALETYQKQVKLLEDRNITLATNQASLQEEMQKLQDTVDRLMAEKLEIETQAAEQAETCQQLTEANNTLSARALTLAEEAASAPEMVKKQLDAQLSECRASLEAAQKELDEMRMSEQSQRIALMDELNTVQTENGNLRAQLRAAKK
ncbi:hypothetical protein HGRIS_010189 [Hohenbuehelia grisea]|uniref:Up-regulated during septation protein 1 domain-containing protein n=1 Tax=Hohenbuehelia grisea TaxID=104357 RepID=A0ABR3J3I6_9AGAR